MKKVLLALALLALAVPASAQLATGNIYGTVHDESGAALAGSTVTLSGPDVTLTTSSGGDGRFRFLNLAPGTYKVTTALSGFTTVIQENVVVNTGSNVDVTVNMKVAQMEETLTVTAETPVIDAKKTGTSTTFSKDELEKIPNSRDPWALLRTVPGILMDRVNIAGNESGQQSNFAGKGALRADGVWSMDGVNITDMAAIGASPTYFDYDAFQEINISTGANDIRQPTGGVGLNFVTKRGTNSLHGTIRGYYTADELEGSNVPDEIANPSAAFRAAGARPVTAETANHIDSIQDWGFDLGGPIVKDKLWFWGSYGKQDIRLVRSAGALLDRTILKDINAKVNWQATSRDMLSVMWFRGAKQKFGRGGAGAALCAGCIEAPSATWNQDDLAPEDLPPGLFKIENNHVFSPNVFMTAKYAYYGTGFKLESVGPLDQQAGQSARLGQTFGSTQSQYFLRPQHTANLDGSWFMSGMGGSHELKFGGSWRQADGDAQTIWPGNMILARDISVSDQRARVFREGNGRNRAKYLSFYLGDSYTRDRLTLNVGLRYDRQWGEARASETQPNAANPTAVPGLVFAGYRTPFTFSDLTPRVGLTYALDDARKTLVRASVARYASQLGTTEIAYMNPSANAGWAEYRWVDANGDHFAQVGEVRFDQAPLASGDGFNPANPTAVASTNLIDPNYRAPLATEAILGLDREVAANLGVSLTYTYRRNTRQTAEIFRGLERSDYAPGVVLTGTLQDGTPYSVQTFVPNDAKARAAGNGRLLTNRPGYAQNYHGVEMAAIKRLADKWMARVAASYFSHTEDFEDTFSSYNGNPTPVDTDPLVQGGEVPIRSAGSGFGDVFYNGKWAVNAYAMYQAPWGLEVAANVFARQGSSFPIFRNQALGFQGTNRVLVSNAVDQFRFENTVNVDFRLSKNIRAGRANIVATADVFNVFNNNVELNRNRNVTSGLFNYLTDNLSPRIVRFGLRLGF